MAVYLNMAEVRAALAGPASVPASQSLLARLFQEVLGAMIEREERRRWLTLLAEEDLSLERWQARLVDHVYRRLVAPRLHQHEVGLHPLAGEVCLMWEALQNLCHWIADGVWAAYRTRGRMLDPSSLAYDALPREIELREPGWSDAVRITDIAEALWSLPGAPAGCAIELRIGPEALGDGLEHAALYHLLSAAGTSSKVSSKLPGHGAGLPLVSFTPARIETVFETARLGCVQGPLKRVIGQLAGVVPTNLPSVSPGNDRGGATPDYTHLARVLLEILREHGIEARLLAPPLAEGRSLQIEIGVPPMVSITRIERLSEDIKARLRLKSPPRLLNFAGRLLLTLELRTRPIVFFWPKGWGSKAE